MRTPTDPKKLVKALQTGRRKLGMTDEEYRDFFPASLVGGRLQSKELSGEELIRRWPCFARQALARRRTRRSERSKASGRKCRSRNRQKSERSSYETCIRRITRVQKIEWCSVEQLQLVIETLKGWIDRIEEPAAREHLQHFFSEQQPPRRWCSREKDALDLFPSYPVLVFRL